MARTLIKTETPGWFIDPSNGEKKVRKSKDGTDVILSRDEYEAAQKGDDMPNSKGAKALKDEAAETVVLTSGKAVTGKTIEITCVERGCSTKRRIKPQDAFQVKRCIPHQQEHRNALRRERRKAKAKAAK